MARLGTQNAVLHVGALGVHHRTSSKLTNRVFGPLEDALRLIRHVRKQLVQIHVEVGWTCVSPQSESGGPQTACLYFLPLCIMSPKRLPRNNGYCSLALSTVPSIFLEGATSHAPAPRYVSRLTSRGRLCVDTHLINGVIGQPSQRWRVVVPAPAARWGRLNLAGLVRYLPEAKKILNTYGRSVGDI